MNIINKITLRHIKQNKKRTIITIVGIIISVAMLTAVTTSFDTLINFLVKDNASLSGDYHYSFSDVTNEDLNTIKQSDNISKIALETKESYAIVNGQELNENSDITFVENVNKEYFDIFFYNIVNGNFPKNSNEVIIPNSLSNEYKLGDKITLNEGTFYNNDGSIVEYSKGNDLSALKGFESENVKEVTVSGFYESNKSSKNFYTAINELDNVNADIAFVKANKLNHNIYNQIDELSKKLDKTEENEELDVNKSLITVSGVFDKNDPYCFTMYGMLAILMIIILIISVELISNSFAISLNEKNKYIGMLASVGATKAQKRKAIYFEGFVLGLIGIPLGIASGLAAMAITFKSISPLISSFQTFSGSAAFNSEIEYVVNFKAILLGILISAITIFISSYIPAKKASKTTAIDAIKQSNSINLKAKQVKTNKLVRKIFGFEGELALKNLKRNGKKSRAITASIAISIILFLTVNSFSTLMTFAFDQMLDSYDYNYNISYINSEENEKTIKNLVAGYDGISLERYSYSEPCYTEELNGFINEKFANDTDDKSIHDYICISLDDNSFKDFCEENDLDANNYLSSNDNKAILINKSNYSNKDNKKVVTNFFNEKDINDKTVTFDVIEEEADETQTKISTSVKIEDVLDKVNSKFIKGFIGKSPILVVNENTFNNMYGEQERFKFAMFMADDSYKFDDYIQEQLNEHQTLKKETSLVNVSEQSDVMNNMFTIMYVFLYGFIATMTLVSLANILNTLTTSIDNRKREFAMLRSVGMDEKGFKKMITLESAFYGINSLAYAIPISIVLHFILRAIIYGMYAVDGVFLPWPMYLIVIGVVFALLGVTLFLSVDKIKEDNIIETLKADDN